jgi:hypothetical protein
MDLLSKKTRIEFREFFTTMVLREIDDFFDSHSIAFNELPADKVVNGQRRNRVEGYYYAIDWTSTSDVGRILKIYEDVLNYLQDNLDTWNGANLKVWYEKLQKVLFRDDYKFENNKLTFIGQTTNFDNLQNATDLLDKSHFQEYTDRIQKSILNDPGLAIGSTKELVEATLKTILTHLDIEIDKKDDVPKLLKKVQQGLEIVPDSIDDAVKGADMIKILLNNLGSVVIKLTELRNLYGTGHGKEKKRNGLSERHARLAVGAGITLSTFLLETFEYKRTK